MRGLTRGGSGLQEAKPYKSDNDVLAMTNLVDAYQRNNITEFEKVLKTNRYAPAELPHSLARDFVYCLQPLFH